MIRLSLIIISVLSLCACSSGVSDKEENNSSSNVSGTWVSDCIVTEAHIGAETITFSDESMSISSRIYFDGSCPSENGDTDTSEKESNYSLGDTLITESGNEAYELNFDVFVDNEFLYTKQDIVSIINGQLYFGIPVSSAECDPDELVYIGPTVRDLCNQRPSELNFEEPYEKQL